MKKDANMKIRLPALMISHLECQFLKGKIIQSTIILSINQPRMTKLTKFLTRTFCKDFIERRFLRTNSSNFFFAIVYELYHPSLFFTGINFCQKFHVFLVINDESVNQKKETSHFHEVNIPCTYTMRTYTPPCSFCFCWINFGFKKHSSWFWNIFNRDFDLGFWTKYVPTESS